MLPIPDRPLPAATATQLGDYQAEVDTADGFAARVDVAKRLFASRNRKDNPTFQTVRSVLAQMCGGIRRCMYCEDSVADEIEHIRPKDLYPDLVFVWPNYLYACGPCNGGKSNKYFVFRAGTQELVNVARRWNEPSVPPPDGLPVFLDPRQENPLDWLRLDLLETFRFLPRRNLNDRDRTRAKQTIEILGLNDRELLPKARRVAYESLLALLERYARQKAEQAAETELAKTRAAILDQPHPTVWAEMKRQRHLIPELDRLFSSVPEALTW